MPPRDADATRSRLLTAAATEFARYGVAGARVERIAAAAQSNKAQIYHYFNSKDGLFAAVIGAHVEATFATDYFDATALPETAAAIFDTFVDNPELARLAHWLRVEATSLDAPMPALEDANAAKIRAIEKAQSDGIVTDRLPAAVLLGLIVTIASAWTDLPPGFDMIERDFTVAQQREFVIESVRRLVAP
ncbi:TetR family transcriptional regulator [Nocardioides sp. NPDC101246]|uniref:TetR family transcriptional regulator n=1 Tax=Nocardioides sp. NPDC101246 TaxID=3364336 RepID=UPI0038219B03